MSKEYCDEAFCIDGSVEFGNVIMAVNIMCEGAYKLVIYSDVGASYDPMIYPFFVVSACYIYIHIALSHH